MVRPGEGIVKGQGLLLRKQEELLRKGRGLDRLPHPEAAQLLKDSMSTEDANWCR